MKFSCADLRPGDHIVWRDDDNSSELEVVVVNVDHVARRWTHLTVLSNSRPGQVGEFYTTAGSSLESWKSEWLYAEIVSRSS